MMMLMLLILLMLMQRLERRLRIEMLCSMGSRWKVLV